MHLAAGRDLTDWRPFSGTVPPFSPTWLSDLLFFALYSAVGGPGLVLVKALLVVGLALLLLRLSRAEQGWWIAVVSTVLALLAMSTRFLLQPATLSYLMLALVLWLVRRREDVPANQQPSLLPPWPLLLLFVIWVNLDRWFAIGLLTVALVWLGQTLDLAREAEETERQRAKGYFGLLLRRSGGLLVAWLCSGRRACSTRRASSHSCRRSCGGSIRVGSRLRFTRRTWRPTARPRPGWPTFPCWGWACSRSW
jgi:hypothetical protein